ncbi:MAG: sugar transferase [Candidatus Krumholzibacteria bacterium]|nr:sugar transferase [Candidatus Krumholzibacteria bacterium]
MLKRTFDILGALAGLLLLAIPLVFLVLKVRRNLGAPVLFVQDRPGFRGRIFRIFKFRTMTDRRDKDGLPLSDAARLTPFGQWLRATSLDELPELFNVLRGDMSLVGPRPLLVEYLPLYSREQARRHEVRPGITGWSQINGRNAVDWDERLAMDVWYVENQSMWLDLRILVKTVSKVVRRDGISQDGQATMERFRGSNR